MDKKLFENQGKKIFSETSKESLDILEKRIEKLKDIFPSVVSDGKIDFSMLKQVLGKNITEKEDRYRFTWNQKNKAILEPIIKTTKTLRPESPEELLKNTENLYIEGENLEALKILQESYAGEIKMIYIDPPYNTGNDFIYNDKFANSDEEAQQKEGLKDKNNKRIETLDNFKKNTKDSSKFHTEWLNMMYPRLSLAKDLLTDDGVIFISIDDNEVHNLRKICDEIFGENNFVSSLIWRRRKTQANLTKNIAPVHDFIVVYAKNISKLNFNKIPYSQEFIEKTFKNPDNDNRGLYQTRPLAQPSTSSNLSYEIKLPNGKKITSKWSCSKQTFNKYLEEKKLYIPNEGEGMPRLKIFLSQSNGMLANTWLDNLSTTEEGSKIIRKLFGGIQTFDFPKPVKLITFLINLNINRNDIILDFFSGSATTAHAVMQLNAEDGGNRKYIMVQLPEETDEKSEAFKAGYKNICEIGKARIRKAAEQIKKEIEGKNKQLKLGEEPKKIPDLDFKTFKIDSTNFKEWEGSMEEIKNSIKDGAADIYTTYKKCRSEIDIISEVIIKEGYKLTDKIEIIEIDSEKIYKIADGLLYIFLKTLNNNIINKIIELYRKNKEELYIDNPKLILNETYMTTEIKSNIKKTLESEGIVDIKTL